MIISKFSFLFPLWYMCVTILYCACSISAIADYSILSNVAGAFPFADGIGPISRFNSPAGVAISPDGSFALITDATNHNIRMMLIPSFNVTTLAGAAFTPGSRNGIGSNATFNKPYGISISPDGSYALIADTGNNLIRKLVISSRVVTTFAESFNSPAGVAISPDGSFALVTDTENRIIRQLTIVDITEFPTFTPSSDPTFEPSSNPTFTPSSDPTFEPSSEPTFTPSSDPTFEPSSNPTFIPSSNPTFTPSVKPTLKPTFTPSVKPTSSSFANGNITVSTIAGIPGTISYSNGEGTNANFNTPYGIGISPDGSYALIGDSQNHMIRKILLSTFSVTLFAGSPSATSGSANGVGTSASFKIPRGIAMSSDGSYAIVADSNNYLIRKIITSTATVSTFVADTFNIPNSLALSSDGSFALVADSGNTLIRKIITSTSSVSTLAGGGSGSTNGIGTNAKFNSPNGITISSDGSYALIGDLGNHLIRKIIISTASVSTIAGVVGSTGSTNGIGTNAKFYQPYSLTLSSDGSYALIADFRNHLIRKLITSTSSVSTIAGVAGSFGSTNGIGTNAKFYYPYGITLSSDGSFGLIGDTYNHVIRKIQVASSSPTSSPSFVPTRKPT